VFRPYTGRAAATSRATRHASRAAATAAGPTRTRASRRATAATSAHVSDEPPISIISPSSLLMDPLWRSDLLITGPHPGDIARMIAR
jgi:hypothetical protein